MGAAENTLRIVVFTYLVSVMVWAFVLEIGRFLKDDMGVLDQYGGRAGFYMDSVRE
jgi:hypothetical protein